ncbi:MAG: diphosphomevalonate decarboxylase [Chloroflexi bacterium RBG_16_54_18]|nr:MAG: diphosphomevalonate decarboxylase [Chloroflexi bacterium RBG_16_54_18]
MHQALAVAHPNIAFIKYWGNRDHALRIPSNGSISMNLGGLTTLTLVSFESGLDNDQLTLNGIETSGFALSRVTTLLERVRAMSGIQLFARVQSENNFPSGTGIASSASAFAALSLAAASAAGMQLEERELSRLARTASGSACRSVPAGFVEWQAGVDHQSSFASSIAPPSHWPLVDLVAVVSREHKFTGSYKGHQLADTSPLQASRLKDAPKRLDICRRAILNCDFEALAEVVELDSNMMHAVIMTSNPRLQYWLPATITIMLEVSRWRISGTAVCYTIDAGPNVHVLCDSEHASEISKQLTSLPGVLEILISHPGGATRLESVNPGN